MATPVDIVTGTGKGASATVGPVTVTVEDPTAYYCGLCRPKAIAMTFNPMVGYLCPRHGTGMSDVIPTTTT